MATTKIHEIRSTLRKAIRYICNPEKTRDMMLVSSFNIPLCSSVKDFSYTAEAVMNMTAKSSSSRAKKGNRLAYHLIQSFSPEDNITPEMAFEIGQKYAERITGNKYEYVVATHEDREHIHTHIIFNATSFETKKKYHHGSKDIKRIQDISDRLCREYNTSVINEKTGRKGMNHEEYEKAKRGTSWRTKLANLIDEAVYHSSNFDEFIFYLEQEGVTVKQGKNISFKCELLGQERACRGKSIGSGYTKESIIARINNDVSYLSAHDLKRYGAMEFDNQGKAAPKDYSKPKKVKDKEDNSFKNEKIRLIKDVHEIEKAMASKAYANKVDVGNISNIIKSVNFLEEHGFNTSEELASYEVELSNRYKLAKADLDATERNRALLSQRITMVQNYRKNHRCYIDYLRSRKSPSFRKEHEQELKDFLLADIYFKHNNINVKEENLSNLFSDLRELNGTIKSQRQGLAKIKNELREVQVVRKNYEKILDEQLVDSSDEVSFGIGKREIHKEENDFFFERKGELTAKYSMEKELYDELENRRKSLSSEIENLQKYIKNQSTYRAYKKSGENEVFYADNKNSLDEFIEALKFFEDNNIEPDSLKLSELFAELKEIIPTRNEKKESVRKLKNELKDYELFGDDEKDIVVTHVKKSKDKTATEKDGNRSTNR